MEDIEVCVYTNISIYMTTHYTFFKHALFIINIIYVCMYVLGLAFAAIWSMFLVLWMAYYNTSALRKNSWGSELMIGFLIGMSGMMSQMFFFLACVFFGYGTSAASKGYKTENADKAMGSFCFFNFILYALWTNLLINKRAELIDVPPPSQSSMNDPYHAPIEGKRTESYANQSSGPSIQSRAPEPVLSAGRSFDSVNLTDSNTSNTSNNDTIEI